MPREGAIIPRPRRQARRAQHRVRQVQLCDGCTAAAFKTVRRAFVQAPRVLISFRALDARPTIIRRVRRAAYSSRRTPSPTRSVRDVRARNHRTERFAGQYSNCFGATFIPSGIPSVRCHSVSVLSPARNQRSVMRLAMGGRPIRSYTPSIRKINPNEKETIANVVGAGGITYGVDAKVFD
jgi:hypothetical protein